MTNNKIYNWKKYNLNKSKLIQKIILYNQKNNFNFLEKNHFNHTRDIIALSIATIKKKGTINVLDYGSNLLALSNFNNKINLKKYNFCIYDPFFNKEDQKIKTKIKNLNYNITNNLQKITNTSFDVLNFASSIQYQSNFLSELKKLNLKKTIRIIITYTPFSLGRTYESIQSNHLNLVQKVYSYKEIISNFKKLNFNLIFQFRNSDKYIACKKKKFKTFSLNLIFSNEE